MRCKERARLRVVSARQFLADCSLIKTAVTAFFSAIFPASLASRSALARTAFSDHLPSLAALRSAA